VQVQLMLLWLQAIVIPLFFKHFIYIKALKPASAIRAEIMAGLRPGSAAGTCCSEWFIMVKRMQMFIPDFRVQASFKLPADFRVQAIDRTAAAGPGIVSCIPPESRDKKYVEV
jgi:hypothetical protein